MDASDLARWRLATQGLWPAAAPEPGSVIDHVVASQSQDLLPGRWSLAQRCSPTGTDRVIAHEADQGRILRTHVLRPTWHFVTPTALPWLLAATAPRVHKAMASMNRQVQVDDELMRAARPVITSRLEQTHSTRAELGSALAVAGIEAQGVRLAHILMYAELEGWICSGRQREGQQAYALLEERVPSAAPVPREEALVRLADAFFASRGPATVKDLAGWASLTLTEARRAAAELRTKLDEVEVDGRTFLTPHGSRPPPAPKNPRVHLVQAYDEIVSSYPDSRGEVFGGRVLERERTPYTHAVLVNGRLLGRWRYERDSSGRPHRIETRLVRELSIDERSALEGEVSRFEDFVGQPVEWR